MSIQADLLRIPTKSIIMVNKANPINAAATPNGPSISGEDALPGSPRVPSVVDTVNIAPAAKYVRKTNSTTPTTVVPVLK